MSSSEKFKIGNYIQVKNKRSKYFSNHGIVTKITSDKLHILLYDSGEKDHDYGKNIILKKNDVEKTERFVNVRKYEIPSFNIGGKKKISLKEIIEDIFPENYFDELLLFHTIYFGGVRKVEGRKIGKIKIGKNKYISGSGSGNILDKILEEGKLFPKEGGDSCVFFTPIPKRLFKEYYLDRFSKEYPKGDSFICLREKVLCEGKSKDKQSGLTSPDADKRWFGVTFGAQPFGPLTFYINEDNETYVFERCNEGISGGFRNSFIKGLTKNFTLNNFGPGNNEEIGTKNTYFLEDEGRLIERIKEDGFWFLFRSELFFCNDDWEKNSRAELKFKKRDVLIKNYGEDINQGEEEIKRVLLK